MLSKLAFVLLSCLVLLVPNAVVAAETLEAAMSFTDHWLGYAALVIFVGAYTLVILEEQIHLQKSKPLMVAAGIIWGLIAIVYAQRGDSHTVQAAVRHNLLEYAELFFFLMAALTYVNTMDERGIFKSIRARIMAGGYSLRQVFWVTGTIAFFLSPFADNLTTAILMASVVVAVSGKNRTFATVGCINVVVAANAGGAFSPFGDITTLMVWQKDIIQFQEFFVLFLPSLVNWLIPATIMSLSIGKGYPESRQESIHLRHGAFVVTGLFALTIAMAVIGHNVLHLPPVVGMMTGLGVLKLYGYYLNRRDRTLMVEHGRMDSPLERSVGGEYLDLEDFVPRKEFNIFVSMKRIEWDTMMFFYGIMLCVGGLGTIGYLELVSGYLYGDLGATTANVLVGILSAIVDNIPVMFAVLSMNPDMGHTQWLLVTLTAGVGGSLLSFGSAAGVAVMGQARGIYTFFGHLKWLWAIALGYAASIVVHLLING